VQEGEPKRALWDALLAAFGLDPAEVDRSPHGKQELQRHARDLWDQQATPGEVARRLTAMRRDWSVRVTPGALVKHWHEYPKPQRTPVSAGLYWHPDRCPSPCIGCAADRKANHEVG
jgi:hypothetical protein